MKNAVKAPLLSAFVIPGLGQLINGSPFKGMACFMATTLWVLVAAAFSAVKVSNALAALEDAPAGSGIGAIMLDQGAGWLFWLGLVFLVLWLGAVADAFLQGKKIDAEKN